MAHVWRALGARGVRGRPWTWGRGCWGSGLRRTASSGGQVGAGCAATQACRMQPAPASPSAPCSRSGAGGTVDTLERAGRRWVTAVCGTASPSGGLQAGKGQDPNARLSAPPEEAARLLSLRWVAWASGEAAGACEYVCVHE